MSNTIAAFKAQQIERYEAIPEGFADEIEQGIATLSGPTALERVPGSHCTLRVWS